MIFLNVANTAEVPLNNLFFWSIKKYTTKKEMKLKLLSKLADGSLSSKISSQQNSTVAFLF